MDAKVAVLRAESVLRENPGEARNVAQFAGNVTRCLEELEAGCATLSDLDVTAEGLSRASVVVLPYNPGMPPAAVSALTQYLEGGGKVLAFYLVPEGLKPLMHLRGGSHVKPATTGQFSRIRARSGSLEGAPAEIGQASWNINVFEPVPGASEVLADWADSSGRLTGHPCIIASSNSMVMSHVLLPDDPANKRLLLLAMLGRLSPPVWQEAAAAAIARIGVLGSFNNYEEALEGITSIEPGNAGVRESLAAARRQREAARSQFSELKFSDCVITAADAAKEMERAFYLAQKAAPGEFRAFWCHSAFGVQGLSWDEAVSRLASNGFTAIFPNMLWGGATFYPGKTLPVAPEVHSRGDQLAECLAAARKHGIEVHVWKVNWNLGHAAPREFVERMRKEGRLQASSLGKEEPWFCPSHPENQALEIDSMVELARNYAVDGIHFDYIRYPDSDHCFCQGCRRRFEQHTGKPVGKWPGDVLASGSARPDWLEWRRSNITHVVKSVSTGAKAVRPGIKVSAAVFPNWSSERDNIGQDWKHWCEKGYLDFVCPMDYTASNNNFDNMVRRQLEWAGRTPCYPGIGASASTSKFGADKVIDQINITRRHGTGGFIIFNYGVSESRELVPALGLGITARGLGAAR